MFINILNRIKRVFGKILDISNATYKYIVGVLDIIMELMFFSIFTIDVLLYIILFYLVISSPVIPFWLAFSFASVIVLSVLFTVWKWAFLQLYSITPYPGLRNPAILAIFYLIITSLATISPIMLLLAGLLSISIGVLIDTFIFSMLALVSIELFRHTEEEELLPRNLAEEMLMQFKEKEMHDRRTPIVFRRLESILASISAIASGVALFKFVGAAIISASSPYAVAILGAIGVAIIVIKISFVLNNYWGINRRVYDNFVLMYAALIADITFKQKMHMTVAIIVFSTLSFFLLCHVPFSIIIAPTAVAVLAAVGVSLIVKVVLHSIFSVIRAVAASITAMWIKYREKQFLNKIILDAEADKKLGKSNTAINSLYNNKIPFNDLDNDKTPLMIAVHRGYVELAKKLISAGANVDYVNEDSGYTSLIVAAWLGNVDMAKCLIDAGANVDYVHEAGFTSLFIAARLGNVDMAKCLIDAGANVNFRNNLRGSPLLEAAYKGKFNMLKYLISRGAKTTPLQKGDKTALSLAAGASSIGNFSLETAINYLEIALYLLSGKGLDSPLDLEHLLLCINKHYDEQGGDSDITVIKHISDFSEVAINILPHKSLQQKFGSYRDLFLSDGRFKMEEELKSELTRWKQNLPYSHRGEIKEISLGFGKLNKNSTSAVRSISDDLLDKVMSYLISPVWAKLKIDGISYLGILKYTQPLCRSEIEASPAFTTGTEVSAPGRASSEVVLTIS